MTEILEFERFEKNILAEARRFEYPRTPDLAGSFGQAPKLAKRKPIGWAFAIALVLVTIAALLAVPEVRAGILEFLRIGAVQIELPNTKEPTPISTPVKDLIDLSQLIASSNLEGETTMEQARENVDFPIPLPTYPSSLGEPDHVFVQSIDPNQNFVILVWMNSVDAEKVDLALYVIGPDVTLTKGPVEELLATSVKGQPAAYVRGEHFLEVNNLPNRAVLVTATALIWESDGITYRIEADLPVSELVRIAESLE